MVHRTVTNVTKYECLTYDLTRPDTVSFLPMTRPESSWPGDLTFGIKD